MTPSVKLQKWDKKALEVHEKYTAQIEESLFIDNFLSGELLNTTGSLCEHIVLLGWFFSINQLVWFPKQHVRLNSIEKSLNIFDR